MLVKNNSTISPMISPSDNNNNEPVKTTGKTSNDTKSNESPYPYPVKSVTINTCSSLYQNWAKTKKLLYAKALNGLTIPVEYADNIDILSPNEKRSFVTILALHGAPGSHEDFKSYIQHFTRKNIRIIVPNYPDFNITIQTKVFRHSAEEKYEFIKDFLNAINVNRIDLILSHSSSIYPTTLLLCEQNDIKIKSVALFNPAGHRRIQGMRPSWLTEGSVKVYQNKVGRVVFKIFGKAFIKTTNTVTVRPDNMNNVILSAQTMRYSNYEQLEKRLKRLKEMEIPMLWVCSENDRLVEKEIFNEMIDIIDCKEWNIQKYDSNAKIVSQYRPNSKVRILYFNKGGHYAFLKYFDEVIKECDKFLMLQN